jgi:hypothetical protein
MSAPAERLVRRAARLLGWTPDHWRVQREQLTAALPWAVRALGLPHP